MGPGDTSEVPSRRMHHWSPERIEGTLVPASVAGNRCWDLPPAHGWRAGRVWLFATASDAWAFGGSPGVVHAVVPAADLTALVAPELDCGPDGFDEGLPAQFHASSAVVVAHSDRWGAAPN